MDGDTLIILLVGRNGQAEFINQLQLQSRLASE